MMHKDSILILTVPNGKGPRETLVTRPIQKMQKKNSLTWKLVSKFKSSLGYKGITIQSSNHSLEHVQFFSLKQIRSMADECGLEVTKIRAANFVESVFPFSLITRIFRPMQKFDCFVADLLPVTWSSGFYLNLKKKT